MENDPKCEASAFLGSNSPGEETRHGGPGGWGECFKKMFNGSPKIVVWTAVEEVTKLGKAKSKRKKPAPKPQQPGYLKLLIWGVILGFMGCITLVWTPSFVLKHERLKMIRGLPPFEWWKNPPDEVLLRVYVFNVTNSEEFMSGQDYQLHLEEVGPFVFREKLRHTDVRFNDNDTMTYIAHREAIFLPEYNTLSLNSTIIVPNLAVLGLSSYLWNTAMVIKLGFNLLLNKHKAQPIVPVTVYNYFWNLTDPIMSVARQLAPNLVPEENVGVLHQIYKDFVDEITVRIGVKEAGRDFFHLDKFRGNDGFKAWDNETCDSTKGSTEGVSYHQDILRSDVLKYLRKTICRVADLYYTRDETHYGMTGYRFDLNNDTFSQPPPESGCFHTKGLPSLPSGLTDISPCYYHFPIATSFPHFMNSEPAATERIVGLKPDPEKHGSYVVVEPNTGVPFTSMARSQSSLVVRPMNGFPKMKRFSNMNIPMFWAEYNQVGLPWYILTLMIIQVIILPSIETYLSILMIGSSGFMITVGIRRIFSRRKVPNLKAYSSIEFTQDVQKISVC